MRDWRTKPRPLPPNHTPRRRTYEPLLQHSSYGRDTHSSRNPYFQLFIHCSKNILLDCICSCLISSQKTEELFGNGLNKVRSAVSVLCKHQNKYVFFFSSIFLILASCQITQNQLHGLEVVHLAQAWLSVRTNLSISQTRPPQGARKPEGTTALLRGAHHPYSDLQGHWITDGSF